MLQEASSAASEGLDLLLASLKCSLDGWTRVLQIDGRNGCFGFSWNSRRWVECCVAPRAEQEVPVDFWMLGEGFWMVGRVCGGLERKIADIEREVGDKMDTDKMFKRDRSEIESYKKDPLSCRSIYYVLKKI